ncbi:MAG: tetratricopeptide repeat protein [Gammaproteobacteria bacterium]|nr:tetratricopeptide repeat protein [Gammaproteobacteria bacterium]
MKFTHILLIACTWLAACAPFGVPAPDYSVELLSGQVLFGEIVDVADIHSDEILTLNDEMRDYVASRVHGDPQARSRLRKLIRGMIDDGLLNLDYDPNLTYSAIETFENRRGNCLSFSILFAALAREADLDLTFQMVDIPPSFRADGDMIILNNHINVLVKGVRRDINHVGRYVVDFNTAEYNGNYDTKRVSDDYAIALYYSNVAVESMQAGDSKMAFRYLKKGIETDPGIAGLWVNLGALYSRNKHYETAEKAYHQALAIQPSNKSALTNLASLLLFLGREDESRYYSRKVAYYRDRNPYYYYYKARAAYRDKEHEDALSFLANAVKLKSDEHQFYSLRGLVHYAINDYELAARDYEQARDTAQKAQLISGYESKLKALESSLR